MAVHSTRYVSDATLKGNHKSDHFRLGKRLAYLLRYGAKKEGLEVSDQGFVDLEELMAVTLMHDENIEDVKENIQLSQGSRGANRFEMKHSDKKIYVRACYGRKFEQCAYHEGCKVVKLTEQCMNLICSNLDLYSFEDFPDEFIMRTILHKLKRQKRLNNKALRCLVSNSWKR